MPYCNTMFLGVMPERVESILTTLARELFIGGQAAYRLGDDTYSIDAGENDVRAIYDENNKTVKFFCRYLRDKEFYDQKLQSFATKNNIAAKS